MAEMTAALRARYPQHADLIPPGVLRAIDETELLDRLDEAEQLLGKALATPSPVLDRGYRDQARKVLAAQPRDLTEARAAQWLSKADDAYTAQYAETCRAEADAIRSANPPAPRRARATAPAPAPVPRRQLPSLTPAEAREPVTRSWLDAQVKAEVAAARANTGHDVLLKVVR